MAIRIEDKYPLQTIPASADFPDGESQNVVVSGDNLGTPWEKDIIDDQQGLNQAILLEAGITPSGNPDTALVSQKLDGLKKIFAPFPELSDLQANAINGYINAAHIGTLYYTEERATGNGGGAWWKAIAKTTENGYNIVTGNATVSFQLVTGSGVINASQYGIIGDGSTDDTTAVQHLFDNTDYSAYVFKNMVCAVSSVELHKNGFELTFINSFFKGIATSVEDEIFSLKNARHGTLNDIRIDGNWNTNYTSSLHWWSVPQVEETPGQYTTINGLRIYNSKIGLLYGDLEGASQPARNFMAENAINNFITRGTMIPVYFNQPNGFLFLSNPILDSNRNEWTVGDLPDFETDSRCIELIYGNLKIQGGQATKTQTVLGLGIVNSGQLSMTGMYYEFGCPMFSLTNKAALTGWTPENITTLSGVDSLLLNNYNTFELEAGSSGQLLLSGSTNMKRADAHAVSTVPLIDHNDATDWIISLTASTFVNYRESNYISNYSGGALNTHALNLLMSSSRLGSDTYGWVNLSDVESSGSNTNGEYLKMGDGTLHCWKKGLAQTIDINVASDSGFRSSPGVAASQWTPPVTFIDTTKIVVNGTVITSDDVRHQSTTINSGSDIRLQYHSTLTKTAYSIVIDVYAIGKWK